MAAPKTVYSKQDIKATVSGTAHRLGRMPKALTVYGSDAKMKGLFSLDKVLHTKDSGGTDCVIGCVSANTANYKMHAAKRLGHLRITSGTTGEFILLTDGGLNTLPYANANTMFKAATNYTFFSFDNKGTYYQPTTVTLHAKNPSNQWIMSTNSRVLPSGSTAYSATTIGTKETLPISLNSGVTYTFYVYGANQEGTYSGTTTMTYKPMGPCKLVNVHKVSSVSDDPTTGITYDALIFYDYYLSSGIPSGEQPNLYNLFAANTGVTVNTKSLINKEDTGVTDVQVILWADDVLSDGLWYGIPNTYGGTDRKIVQISNGYPIKWYNSTYSPTYDYYNITIDFSYEFHTQVNTNTSSQVRLLKGNGTTNIATTTYGQLAGANTWQISNVAAANLNLIGEQTNKLSINLSNWTCSLQEDVTLTLECSESGDIVTATSDSGSFEGTIVVSLGNLKSMAVGNHIHVTVSLTADGGH